MAKSSKEIILEKIAAASKGRPVLNNTVSSDDQPIYKPILPDAITCFKSELEAINGVCILCKNEQSIFIEIKSYLDKNGLNFVFCRDNIIADQLRKFGISVSQNDNDFIEMQVGITGCEFLIARTGSLMVSSATASGRQMHVFPPIHLVIASATQLVDYVEDAMIAIQRKYNNQLPSTISTITGPSRTADIEKTLVLGAHGPKELVVFLSVE
jgi:L-lactate dehydrogenase complex protein LldG